MKSENMADFINIFEEIYDHVTSANIKTFGKKLTFTFRYLHVKNSTINKHKIIRHDRVNIPVLKTQFSDKTHGLESMQDSHPSAQGRHSNDPETL